MSILTSSGIFGDSSTLVVKSTNPSYLVTPSSFTCIKVSLGTESSGCFKFLRFLSKPRTTETVYFYYGGCLFLNAEGSVFYCNSSSSDMLKSSFPAGLISYYCYFCFSSLGSPIIYSFKSSRSSTSNDFND